LKKAATNLVVIDRKETKEGKKEMRKKKDSLKGGKNYRIFMKFKFAKDLPGRGDDAGKKSSKTETHPRKEGRN